MISSEKRAEILQKALKYFEKANITITEEEKNRIEIADFGLNEIEKTGLEILTYVNTERVCAKELVMLPNQTCPEHRHPPVETGGYINGKPVSEFGKEETFRCRYGKVCLYIEGEPTENPKTQPPEAPAGSYTVFHEIILNAGEQHTLYPNTKHWFKSGDDGAVVSEKKKKSRDELDIFTDKRIVR
jgi:D-lyxose ketol-isomerase